MVTVQPSLDRRDRPTMGLHTPEKKPDSGQSHKHNDNGYDDGTLRSWLWVIGHGQPDFRR
jgi:hypothetical protein